VTSSRIDSITALLISALALGCASTQAGTEKRAVLPPAKLVRVSNLDMTRIPGRPTAIDLTFEVEILPDGSPDLNTLTIFGKGASEMKNAITEWIGASRFEPAIRNGAPVRSKYKGGMRATTRVM
jgi:hypothetical protein